MRCEKGAGGWSKKKKKCSSDASGSSEDAPVFVQARSAIKIGKSHRTNNSRACCPHNNTLFLLLYVPTPYPHHHHQYTPCPCRFTPCPCHRLGSQSKPQTLATNQGKSSEMLAYRRTRTQQQKSQTMKKRRNQQDRKSAITNGRLLYILQKLKYTPAVRSNMLSKLIFASCVCSYILYYIFIFHNII